MSLFRDLEITNDFYGVTISKGEIIVNNGIKNARLPPGPDGYTLITDSTQSTGLKWTQINGYNIIKYFQYNLSNIPFSSNYNNYVNIPGLNSIPEDGDYIILFNCRYSLSRLQRSVTFGLLKNNIHIDHEVVDSICPNRIISFYTQFTSTFNGTDMIDIGIHTDNIDTVITLYDAKIILLKFAY